MEAGVALSQKLILWRIRIETSISPSGASSDRARFIEITRITRMRAAEQAKNGAFIEVWIAIHPAH